MKIGTKFVVNIGISMFGLCLVFFIVGNLTIREIIANMTTANFGLELAGALSVAEGAQKTLVDTGTASAENYVKSAQKEVVDVLKARTTLSGGSLAILDADRKLVLHSTLEIGSKLQEKFIDEMFAEKKGTKAYFFSNTNKFAAFAVFEPWNWLFIYTAPESTLYRAAWSFLNRMSVVSVAGLAIAALGSIILVRKDIVLPIQNLTQVAKKIALGELTNWRFPYVLKNEIGELANALTAIVNSSSQKALALREMTAGNLTVSIHHESENDGLAHDLEEMLNALRVTVSATQLAANSVATGTSEISSSASDLSNNATTQASAIQQISAAITELASQSEQNAREATQGAALGVEVHGLSTSGHEEMSKLIEAMSHIAQSVQDTRKITKLIDEIAFQTNLLALNASVEAARAGKHGKGFAVVADEVRNLAGRSAKAVQETSARVEETLKSVAEGDAFVKSTSERFNVILASADKLSDVMKNMAQASQSSSHGIADIRSSLQEIENVIQSNTSSAEQTAAASIDLSATAKRMDEVIQRFRLA